MPETTNYLKHSSTNPIQRLLIDNFYNQLIRITKSVKPKRILDVGCGEGFTLIKIKHAKIGDKFEGVDNSADAIAIGKKLNSKLNIKEGNIYNLPYQDNSFDLIICTEVLEHLGNPRKALQELRRVSSKYIVLSVPNEPFFILANFLRGKYLKTLGNHPEHINHWTVMSFRNFLRKNGVKISKAYYPFPWTLVLGRK